VTWTENFVGDREPRLWPY